MAKLKVAVSPFYGDDAWVDESTGIKFEKSKNSALTVYDISNETKLDGIRKALRLNALILIEGELPPEEKQVEQKVEEVKEVKKEEPQKAEAKEERGSEDAKKSTKSSKSKKK